jgi:hypothetical protein
LRFQQGGERHELFYILVDGAARKGKKKRNGTREREMTRRKDRERPRRSQQRAENLAAKKMVFNIQNFVPSKESYAGVASLASRASQLLLDLPRAHGGRLASSGIKGAPQNQLTPWTARGNVLLAKNTQTATATWHALGLRRKHNVTLIEKVFAIRRLVAWPPSSENSARVKAPATSQVVTSSSVLSPLRRDILLLKESQAWRVFRVRVKNTLNRR